MAQSVLVLPRADMRRSTRIVRAVPMRVTGLDLLGQPFWERTATLVVNSHGCQFPSKQKLKKNSWVTLGVTDHQANRLLHSVQARVVCVQPPEARQGFFHIAVELEVPGNVWGVTLPPGDWLPFRKPNPLRTSTTAAEPPKTARAPTASPASVPEAELREGSPSLGGEVGTPSAPPVSEVQEQNHKMVREAASVAVAAETSRLVGELRTQLQEEAKKIVEGMAAAHTDQWVRRAAEKLHEAQQASAKALREHWLESEVQKQNQKMVREAASVAVAAETSRLAGELRTQLQEEAKKIVEGMTAAHTDQWVRRAAEKLHEAQQASAKALHEQWSRKIGLDLQEASEHLAARGAELNHSAESLAARTVEQVQLLLEGTGRDSASRFVSRLQQQLAPLLEHTQQVLTKLEAYKEPAELTLQAHGDHFERTLQQSVLEAAARMQETSRQFEQAIRDRLTKALEELERKGTAAISVMLEGFQAISESYQKEAHSRLQAALEQGTNHLREKAAEIPRLFAAELDDYIRSNTEQVRGLIAELTEEHPSSSRAART